MFPSSGPVPLPMGLPGNSPVCSGYTMEDSLGLSLGGDSNFIWPFKLPKIRERTLEWEGPTASTCRHLRRSHRRRSPLSVTGSRRELAAILVLGNDGLGKVEDGEDSMGGVA
ncbi:hypothetical protein V6N13_104342 [Hibiscus sabdariffa]